MVINLVLLRKCLVSLMLRISIQMKTYLKLSGKEMVMKTRSDNVDVGLDDKKPKIMNYVSRKDLV